jgi:hypothetical protein
VEEASGLDWNIYRRGKFVASYMTVLNIPSNLAFGTKDTGFKPGFQN